MTRRVQRRIPSHQWGTARKGLNIFLRDVLYNTYLERDLGFSRVEYWLELPLDSFTVRALRAQPAAGQLPRFPGVAIVESRTYAEFQHAAQRVADDWGIARVHLDAYWWRGE